MRAHIAGCLVLAALLAGCTSDETPDPTPPPVPPGDLTLAPVWQAPVAAAAGCFSAGTVPLERPDPIVVLDTTMGNIEVEILESLVPMTARHFLALVESGHYTNVPFHRIIGDFMMQGGDGQAAAPTIADEFHHRLRHDAKGVLAMANAGPNTGSDQFYITFRATSWLDDWHTVFGHVVRGMDVVDAVNEAAKKGPVQVTLESATVRRPTSSGGLPVDFGVLVPDSSQRVGLSGGRAAYTVIVESCTDHVVTVQVAGNEWAAPSAGFASFELPAGQRRVFALEAMVPIGPAASVAVPLRVEGGGVVRELQLTAVRAADTGIVTVEAGQNVRAHYIGLLTDGRLFDTSYAEVAADGRIAKFERSYGDRPRGDAFSFTPGGGVVAGFTKLAVGTQEGGTNAGSFAPADGYGASFRPGQDISNGHPLTGRTLFFQLEVVDVLPS